MHILYSTEVTAIGGRTGRATAADGQLDVALETPKALGGPGGAGTNPEQLFAAGYAACFLGALKYVAGQKKVDLPGETSVTATVGIGPREDHRGFELDIALAVVVPGVQRDVADDLLIAADTACPYSHLARYGAQVRLTLA